MSVDPASLLHPDAPPEPDDLGPLSDDAIAGDYRIFQRVQGHRFSLDDVVTAWEAAQLMPHARRCLELGSGVGSVLHMLAHKLPEAEFVAIEAQRNSFSLLSRNVARNGLAHRIQLMHGDIRVLSGTSHAAGPFDLVTGTPPYVPPGKATPSPDAQRAYARQEYRGGVEAYVEAGARVLASEGRLVVCGDARFPARVFDSAREAGLSVIRQRDVIPRERTPALFSVWVLARSEGAPPFEHAPPFTARDADGARTLAHHGLRSFFDLPLPRAEAPSP